MGLFFTLLYVFTAYLTPTVLFGPLGVYHMEIILAVPTIIFSAISLSESRVLSMNQTYAAAGLLFSVFASIALTGWMGGAVDGVLTFLPNLLCFFFVAINCRKKGHLQALVAVLFIAAVFVIVMSQIDEHAGVLKSGYFLDMNNEATGEVFHRIRGLGIINDPNDFGQFLIALVPCLFFFWKKSKPIRNLLIVYLPAGILLYGLFLTHSRGAMLALTLCAIVAFRRKLGLIPSIVTGGLLVVGMFALGFTGGRDVSADAGEDRMELWDTGLQLIRANPIFGVGYEGFTNYSSHTAHNTVIVCTAEIGVVGFFFWVLFVLSSLRDAYVVSEYGRKREKLEALERAEDAKLPSTRRIAAAPAHSVQLAQASFAVAGQAAMFQQHGMTGPSTPSGHVAEAPPPHLRFSSPPVISVEEIRRLAMLLVLAMVGLLAAAWFLSRAYVMLLFIFAGMTEVVFRMARDQGMEIPLMRLPRAAKLSLPATFGLVAIVYVILRIDHLRH